MGSRSGAVSREYHQQKLEAERAAHEATRKELEAVKRERDEARALADSYANDPALVQRMRQGKKRAATNQSRTGAKPNSNAYPRSAVTSQPG